MQYQLRSYRFSPITTKESLLEAISHIHFSCHQLCKQSFGMYFPNAGNMGVFCHYDDEYVYLTNMRKELTEESDNLHQKYFRLHEPIIVPSQGDIPETTYMYLYIRKPDPYRHHVGDVDFYMEQAEYLKTKQEMIDGRVITGARILPNRPDLDMIELYDPDVDALAYVSTHTMTETVRVKQSEHTNL